MCPNHPVVSPLRVERAHWPRMNGVTVSQSFIVTRLYSDDGDLISTESALVDDVEDTIGRAKWADELASVAILKR